MAAFRKRPVVIEAAQWFCLGHAPAWAQHAVVEHPDCCFIETLEGKMRCNPGDWIIKGVNGEIYPCKPDIFAATYEAADAVRDDDLAARVFAIAYPTNAQFEMSQPERIADAARRLDQIAELTKANRLPAPTAAPAGTVTAEDVGNEAAKAAIAALHQVRLVMAIEHVAEIPGYMEGHTFFAFSDGTIWCRGQTNGDWARVEGPPTTIHAPLPAVPEVGAVVEDPTP